MNKNLSMLKNLINLSRVSLEMNKNVYNIFEGENNQKINSLSNLKKLNSESEEIIVNSETDLTNTFFLFIDKDDMMKFVNLFQSINSKMYKLGNKRLLYETSSIHEFKKELDLQESYLKEVNTIIESLSKNLKFSELQNNLKNLKLIRSNTDTTIFESLKEVLVNNKYPTNGQQIWERDILQTFEEIFENYSNFSTTLSEFIVKYE
jgi:uncharacterized protein Yka (UPF0111/DUF47 family)